MSDIFGCFGARTMVAKVAPPKPSTQSSTFSFGFFAGNAVQEQQCRDTVSLRLICRFWCALTRTARAIIRYVPLTKCHMQRMGVRRPHRESAAHQLLSGSTEEIKTESRWQDYRYVLLYRVDELYHNRNRLFLFPTTLLHGNTCLHSSIPSYLSKDHSGSTYRRVFS